MTLYIRNTLFRPHTMVASDRRMSKIMGSICLGL